MENSQVLDTIHTTKKGAFIHLEYCTTKRVKTKHQGDIVQKYTEVVGRLGCDYQHLKSTIQKVTSGELAPNGALPWGHWYEGYVNLVIEHKDSLYLRITASPKHKAKSQWLLNGQPVDRQYLIDNDYLYANDVKSNVKSVYDVKFKDIIKIGA